MTKKIIFSVVFLAVIIFLGRNLNPFDPRMFSFHDDTQVARIEQFTLNLTNGVVPPRVAPDISNKLGFPVFNFYAPFSYWLTTAIHIAGYPTPLAVKASFIVAIICSFLFMLSLLRLFFKFPASLLGAVSYASSLWMAVEIFVRGNLAEIWFIALLPLAFYFLTLNARKKSKIVFVLTTIALASIFTVHNVLSLLAVGIFTAYVIMLSHKRQNIISLVLGLMLGAYFLIPAMAELHLTYASAVASKTHYQDHFLCTSQLWKASHWGYGGSATGCNNDDMPFMLGKMHIVLGVAGFMWYLLLMLKKRKEYLFGFFGLLSIGGAFLTTYASSAIWNTLSPVFSLFQFPWRLLVFPAFGLAFFTAYGIDKVPEKIKTVLTLVIAFALLITSSKYFSKPWLYRTDEYMDKYGNMSYIQGKAAYNMAEYLPKTADYGYWRSIEGKKTDLLTESPAESKNTEVKILTDEPFRKEISVKNAGTVTLNLHYFPFWMIFINNTPYRPVNFDKLGRPIIEIATPAIIHVFYEQTTIEELGNTVTVLAFLIITGILLYKPIWIQSLKKSRR